MAGNANWDAILTTTLNNYRGTLVDNAFSSQVGFGKRMYFLNSKYIWLNGDKDRWFVNTPFVRPHTVDARYSQIIAHGEMVISNRKRQGRLDKRIAS
jgi:hypothetical protein